MLFNRIQVESSDNHIVGIVGFRFILLGVVFHHLPVSSKFVLTNEIEELQYPLIAEVVIWRFAVLVGGGLEHDNLLDLTSLIWAFFLLESCGQVHYE